MKRFKFFTEPLFQSHDGGDVYPGEVFYTVLKEDYVHRGVTLPRYSIIERTISIDKRYKFKVNNDMVWYFRSISNAEYLIRIWKKQDTISGGEVFHKQSDIIITFNKHEN